MSEGLSGRALVHVATHCFFATGECRSAIETGGAGHDPMLLSGLVLAAANHTADPFSPEDGISIAVEVSTLDLSDTGLVVLSARETGLGEIRSGQGVLGLRRGFAISGARTWLMSLWSIPDAETRVLMDEVYRRHLGRWADPPPAALREAQLALLAAQRAEGTPHPYAWAAFIMSGDWRSRPPR